MPVTAALAKVTMSLSAEMRAYWPLASLRAQVGSKFVHLATQKVLPNGDVDVEVHSVCGTPTTAIDAGLAPGIHLLELRVTLAGITLDLPPLLTAIELSCELPLADGGVGDGGNIRDADGGGDAGTMNLDANASDGARDPKPAGGGCSAASRVPQPQGMWLALVPLAGRLLRRRKPARITAVPS
ncbi:MAG: hypothetical protein SF187_05510 [Deltaproteobacteria bacterium]|nr:hypothetical protein [Deltaproteobacteria bacterium]